VETLLKQHFSKERNHTYLILAMMIFETGQRTFIDGDALGGEGNGPASRFPRLASA
jgi:hypothetical protein